MNIPLLTVSPSLMNIPPITLPDEHLADHLRQFLPTLSSYLMKLMFTTAEQEGALPMNEETLPMNEAAQKLGADPG